VRKFQENNKDIDGVPLKVDGMVGPRTADALNRRMVGVWYDKYETPKEMTEGKTFITVTSELLTRGIEFENRDEVQETQSNTGVQRKRRTDGRAAFETNPEPLRPGSLLQILDAELDSVGIGVKFEENKTKERTTNEAGTIKVAKGKTFLALVGKEEIPAQNPPGPPAAPAPQPPAQ
jgi:hypothetical protein